jgi:hypothetical protein
VQAEPCNHCEEITRWKHWREIELHGDIWLDQFSTKNDGHRWLRLFRKRLEVLRHLLRQCRVQLNRLFRWFHQKLNWMHCGAREALKLNTRIHQSKRSDRSLLRAFHHHFQRDGYSSHVFLEKNKSIALETDVKIIRSEPCRTVSRANTNASGYGWFK